MSQFAKSVEHSQPDFQKIQKEGIKFLACVPVAVRNWASHYILGNDRFASEGWAKILAMPDNELEDLESKIKQHHESSSGQPSEQFKKLSNRCQEIKEYRSWLADNVACMYRLVTDDRMNPAYAVLVKELTGDEQWDKFFHAAWAAKADYFKNRENLRDAAEISAEISSTAKKLVELVRKFSETAILAPSEFFHIPALLEHAKNKENPGENDIWQSCQPFILGKLPEYLRDETRLDGATSVPDSAFPVKNEQNGLLATIRYGWEKAPPVSALLDVLADAAEKFVPAPDSDSVAAALASRENNIKTGYIRAFATLLKEREFNITPKMIHAMATMTTVVINLPDIDATYDDVRKTLARPAKLTLEDSNKK